MHHKLNAVGHHNGCHSCAKFTNKLEYQQGLQNMKCENVMKKYLGLKNLILTTVWELNCVFALNYLFALKYLP